MQQIDNSNDEVDTIGDQIISEVIDRIKSNFSKFEKYMKSFQNKKVIILCGNTGAGKSSIYNWIIGASFQMVQKDGIDYLQPDHNEEIYTSKMGTNTNSVTQTSIYSYIEELDHVLVDLPGFESTLGDYHKLFIDLLFHKITSTYQAKIVYVLDNPQKELQNRGKDFTQFIQQQIGHNIHNIPNIYFIVNKYAEDGQDNEQIQRIKVQLEEIKEIKGRMLKNIYIIRKIKNKEMIQNVFTEQARKNLIQTLKQTEIITVQPNYTPKLSRGDVVNNYLLNKGTHYFKKSKQMSEQIKNMIDNKKTFKISPENQKSPNSDFNIPQSIKGLYELYTLMIEDKQSKIAEEDEFQNFKKIYDYFFPYEKNLNCYSFMNAQLDSQIHIFNIIIDYLKQAPPPQLTQNVSKQPDENLEVINTQNRWEIVNKVLSFVISIGEMFIKVRFLQQPVN